mmetsp:Transcript_25636/g.59151  ORF Transcript_25636/g.59151 Transcript_25636/m.59151 type:complete len:213 (-) Transcript_25636:310-948(-)
MIPSCILCPTTVLHESRHFGLYFMSFVSVEPMGLVSAMPISNLTVHFPPQKSQILASRSSMTIPRLSSPLLKFSPANNSIFSVLSAPSAHCTGGYSTTTSTFGHLRILFTRSTTSSASDGSDVSTPIVASKSRHSHPYDAISSTTSTPLPEVVRTSTPAMASPGMTPAAAAFPPTASTMTRPRPSSRPPASSRSSMPIPPARETVRATSSTK